MKQQPLALDSDPLAQFKSYLGAGHERLEGAARSSTVKSSCRPRTSPHSAPTARTARLGGILERV